MLTASDLSCLRGELCLFENLDLRVGAGQCLHVVGANGSGKTSLLRILAGIRQADSGYVYWDGKPSNGNDDYFSSMAYLAHKDGLKAELSGDENLRLFQTLSAPANTEQIDQILHQISLLDKADLPVQSLSFGQRRRLAFSRLLLHPKKLWILDEPFTGIDDSGRTLLESLCESHLSNGGVLVLTHHRSLNNTVLAPFIQEFTLQ